jgi:alkanesulfonate monooxygenase SsuD/methylene tetrahydromethanopterin reductase-like flavin-dependent oxidoreductase (luciferase family)
MTIQFGTFDHIEIHGGRPVREVYEERISLLRRAEAGGFYAFHLAEHHGHDYSVAPSQPVFLSALARETTTLKLIPTVVCLPLHHPIRIFEELAMLDVLSDGRLELGVGKGITPFEHLMFGHPPEEASARSLDSLRMLLHAWETGIMSSDGSPYFDFLEFQLPFSPVQHPYPPLWTAGNVETAGRGGHNFIFPVPIPAEVRAHYDELREASRQEPGHQNPHVTAPWIAQSQALVIASTDEEAERIARRAWDAYKAKLMKAHGVISPHLQTGVPELDNPLAKKMLGMDPFAAQIVVAGSPETVREYYVEQAQRGIANYFMLMTPFGDMTFDEASYTIDAFIADVIPAVRDVEAGVARA